MRMTIQPRTRRQDRAARRVAGPRSRRFALVGAVVVLGLTACGSADDGSAGSASTLPAPAVIQIAGSATGGAAPTAAGAADAAMSESKMMPMSLTYTWSGETPDLTAPAGSWFFAPGVAPTAEQVEQLAAAFGVTGDAVELAADMGGGWTVGPNDGSAPSVTVAADAMQSWWFSPAWQTEGRGIVDDCALYPAGDPAADPTTAGQPVCEPAQPPAGVPSADEAEASALALLASLGGDPAGYELETYADEWSASVTAFLVLDGVRTNLSFNVGYGEEGAITWAGGLLAAPRARRRLPAHRCGRGDRPPQRPGERLDDRVRPGRPRRRRGDRTGRHARRRTGAGEDYAPPAEPTEPTEPTRGARAGRGASPSMTTAPRSESPSPPTPSSSIPPSVTAPILRSPAWGSARSTSRPW